MQFLITAMSIPLAILTGRLCASIAGNYEDDYPGVVNDSRNDSHDWGSIQLNVQVSVVQCGCAVWLLAVATAWWLNYSGQ